MTVTIDPMIIWVQIHEVPIGFRSEKVCMMVGNTIGEYIESNQRNFSGLFQPYMRINVRINAFKGLLGGLHLKRKKG